MALLSHVLVCCLTALCGLGHLSRAMPNHQQHYVETFSSTVDGHILVRSKRSTQVCKYKKGEWKECDKLVMLMTRKDSLKEKNSGPSCEKVRTITKNCKDKEEKDEGICVFEKPKHVPWSSCKEGGVRQRVLKLIKEKGDKECPKEKVMSKKCKDDKKTKDHHSSKTSAPAHDQGSDQDMDKCEFGAWSMWSQCQNNKKFRSREAKKNEEKKLCVKNSVEKVDC